MNTSLKRSIVELARASTQEVCGFLYATQDTVKHYPCRNVDEDPITSFTITKEDQLACIKLGVIVGVYHSHPNGPAGFSEGDIFIANEAALPFYLYDVVTGTWSEYLPPTYHVKLEGRPFYWGFDDCYGAARHYYRETLGLHLGDYDRDSDYGTSNSMTIMERFEHEGFILLPPDTTPQPHDAMIFSIGRYPQHLAVFTGNQRMFHHPLNALSRIDLLDGRYLERLSHVLRHKTLVVSV